MPLIATLTFVILSQKVENRRQMSEIEDRILDELSTCSASILEDEKACHIIMSSKVLSQEIKEKQVVRD